MSGPEPASNELTNGLPGIMSGLLGVPPQDERRRVRIYLVERNAVADERASIERAARREMTALHGIHHPGIVQVDTMEPHEGGPALIFRHGPRAVRLDHYLAQHGDKVEAETRIGMIRQLAEVVAPQASAGRVGRGGAPGDAISSARRSRPCRRSRVSPRCAGVPVGLHFLHFGA